MPRHVIGLGAGGHAKVVIDILRTDDDIAILGLLDSNPALRTRTCLGVPVLGADDQLPGLYHSGLREAFLGVGGLVGSALRERLFRLLTESGFRMIDAIHPRAVLSPTCRYGPGLTVLPLAVINADASLGANVLVNTGAIVEHDCRIGDHCLIGPGAILAGGVEVESGALIGMGACIREGVRIGPRARIGAAALVRRDVPEGATVYG